MISSIDFELRLLPMRHEWKIFPADSGTATDFHSLSSLAGSFA
jgi:hypothetical protein